MANSPLIFSPVVGQDAFGYSASYNGFVYAFNSNGTLLWTYFSGMVSPYALGTSLALGNNQRIFLSSLAYFGGGGIQCIAETPPSCDVIPSSNSPSMGEPFTIDVVVQPVGGAFDAWGVIFAPGGKKYSFVLGRPGSLKAGMYPLVLNVGGLDTLFSTRLLSIPELSAGTAGAYNIYVGLFPAGRPPTLPHAIPDYIDHETVVIH